MAKKRSYKDRVYAMDADEVARLVAHMVSDKLLVPALKQLYARPTYKKGTSYREREVKECEFDKSRRMVDIDMLTTTVVTAFDGKYGTVQDVCYRALSFMNGMHEAHEEFDE